jgi:hypothetical protein
MSDIWLNIIVGISTALIGLLAFVNEINKKNRDTWYKSVWLKLIVLFIGSFLIIVATIWKEANSQKRTNVETKTAVKEQSQRDSLNSMKFLNYLNDALTEHGFQYDTNTKEISVIVKDSSKHITNNIYGSDPSLAIDSDLQIQFLKNDSVDLFNINLACIYAAAKNIDLIIYCLIERNAYVKYLCQKRPFPINFELVSGQTVHIPFLSTIKANPATTKYYFLLKGTYTNSDQSKSFQINVLYGFDILKNFRGIVSEPENSDVRKFLAECRIGYSQ